MTTTVVRYEEPYESMLPRDCDDDLLVDIWLNLKLSRHTRIAYAKDIAAFRAFVQKPLKLVNLLDVQEYQQSLTGKPNTQRRRMTVVKSLFTFGAEANYLTFNVPHAIKLGKVNRGLAQRILSTYQVHRMIALETDQRNRTILRLLYHAGLRCEELISLKWNMLAERNYGQGQLTVIGKGDKERYVLVGAEVWAELQALRTVGYPGEWVFYSRKKRADGTRHLSQQQLWQIVHQAAVRAGIQKCSPHFLRHSCASHALDKGASISLVKEVLGHESLDTTSLYTHARPGQTLSDYLE